MDISMIHQIMRRKQLFASRGMASGAKSDHRSFKKFIGRASIQKTLRLQGTHFKHTLQMKA